MPALNSKQPAPLQAPPNPAATIRLDYMRAALAREYAKPLATSSIEAANIFKACAESALDATDPADPRWIALWAQAERAHRDLTLIQQTTRKANNAEIRRRGKREREYWRERLAM